jgi:sec-independent protein translocase protein TatA
MFRNGLEPWHILVLLVVLVLLFGSKRLPDAARGLGRSMRIFKSEIKSMQDDGGAESTSTTEPGAPTTNSSGSSSPDTAPRSDG